MITTSKLLELVEQAAWISQISEQHSQALPMTSPSKGVIAFLGSLGTQAQLKKRSKTALEFLSMT
jgi:hypothetical protein